MRLIWISFDFEKVNIEDGHADLSVGNDWIMVIVISVSQAFVEFLACVGSIGIRQM